MDLHTALVQLFGSLGALLILTSLLLIAFGGPVIILLTIRFLWFRHVYVGKSKEMETLIWQLHRIASALERGQATAPPTETRPDESKPQPVLHSMFGR